jgi:hypothetical protein
MVGVAHARGEVPPARDAPQPGHVEVGLGRVAAGVEQHVAYELLGTGVVDERRLHRGEAGDPFLDGHVVLRLERVVGREGVLDQLAGEVAQGQAALLGGEGEDLSPVEPQPSLLFREPRIDIDGVHGLSFLTPP